ncbi:transcriptional regulator, LuxR family [Stackebrandtia nassauensis DSM 44728]|uniref:Transcriptional regulator, LuxR family n=1 Tax=Stackebrandtia nassauensis (strain DSM 44728 / CIP 108903 / NRRL B-16338 / NBRC 102104 / LLR-40K-21) TaxID=446470 RepID=D3Q3P4_STANL|nr:transcriptional regulator, LuxR family [Stackebrandtia nassauensis DSM 44728]
MSTIVYPPTRGLSAWEAACRSAAIIAREAARDRRRELLTHHGRVLLNALAAAGIDLEPKPPVVVRPPGCRLTERELTVVIGMSNGKSNARIGRELHISEDTVKTYARRLFRKLGVGDRTQAVAVALRTGLIR